MSAARPNVVVILADDMGFSDLGCFGGEISTPNIDRIGREGARFTQFYNTARCSPSRASLLTGRHPHETGIGVLTDDERPAGYPGSLSTRYSTLAEHFSAAGYATCLSGKWHLSASTDTPDDSWPTRRGFDEFYGVIGGAGDYFHPRGLWHGERRQPVPVDPDYYFTDEIGRHASDFVREHTTDPFFLYLAFTAPHWPLHAREDDIARHEGSYDEGWDSLRPKRLQRLIDEGLLPVDTELSERDPSQPAWADVEDKAWEARRMAVYAAQIESMDRAVGHVLDTLEQRDVLDDTIIVFLSDNGACAEELPPADAPKFLERQPSHTPDGVPLAIGNDPAVVPGPDTTFSSYGKAWANLSNTPFRLYKRWVHEGGIATPFLVRWPQGFGPGDIIDRPYQLTDVLPTLLAAAGLRVPEGSPGVDVLDVENAPHTLYWEHIGNKAIRREGWKLVQEENQPWELYDVGVDRSELHDRSAEHPDLVEELTTYWQRWADSVGVLPRPNRSSPTPEPKGRRA